MYICMCTHMYLYIYTYIYIYVSYLHICDNNSQEKNAVSLRVKSMGGEGVGGTVLGRSWRREKHEKSDAVIF